MVALALPVPDLPRDRQRLRVVVDGLGLPPEAVVRDAEVADNGALALPVPEFASVAVAGSTLTVKY
eukprot:COSAG02_NODE_21265_length_796_cov_0.632712_2_plen_65_part_01